MNINGDSTRSSQLARDSKITRLSQHMSRDDDPVPVLLSRILTLGDLGT